MSGSEAGVQFLMKFWIICFMFARTSCKVVLFDTLTAPSDISCCVYMLANCWAALMLLRHKQSTKRHHDRSCSLQLKEMPIFKAQQVLCTVSCGTEKEAPSLLTYWRSERP